MCLLSDVPSGYCKPILGDIPFSELMKYIISYKRTGTFPIEKMTHNKKGEFRRKARKFKLEDNGDLMYIGQGKFVVQKSPAGIAQSVERLPGLTL